MFSSFFLTMNFEPKIEPGSPSTNHVILDDDDDEVGEDPVESTLDLEGMSILDLVRHVLFGSCLNDTFDRVQVVFVTRHLILRQQNQHLQKKLHLEKHSRLHVEDEFNKRE